MNHCTLFNLTDKVIVITGASKFVTGTVLSVDGGFVAFSGV